MEGPRNMPMRLGFGLGLGLVEAWASGGTEEHADEDGGGGRVDPAELVERRVDSAAVREGGEEGGLGVAKPNPSPSPNPNPSTSPSPDPSPNLYVKAVRRVG